MDPQDIEPEYVLAEMYSLDVVTRAYERDFLQVLLSEPCPDALEAVALVDAADFAHELHGELFRWLRKSYQKYRTVDQVELLAAMSAAKARPLFTLANELWTTTPSYGAALVTRVKHYATRVHDLAQQRRLVEVARLEARALAGESVRLPDGFTLDANTSPETVVAATAAARRKLTRQDGRAGLAKPLSSYRREALTEVGVSGLPFGLARLDEILRGGAKQQSLIILGARPAMGKTAFMLNAVKHWIAEDCPGVVFSLEMAGHQLYQRLLADLSEIDSENWAYNPEKVTKAANLIDSWGVEVVDRPGTTLEQVRAECDRRASIGRLGWIMVDYLTIMGVPEGFDRHDLAIGALSRGLKEIAKEYQIPVLLAAQLNRNLESRQNKRPILADLREAGQIEQDADVIMFLYRDHYYNPNEADPREAEIIVAKNRFGVTDTALAVWNGPLTRFEDPVESPDVLL